MKEFPNHLRPKNKEKFSQYRFDRNLAYLRKEIFELMLMGDENNYYALDNFSSRYGVSRADVERMRDIVMQELSEKNWNVKFSFGGTALFVYSTSDPPPSCYEDEF